MSKIPINISEYKWCECSINDRIQLLYQQYYKLCVYRVSSIKGLDEHTKKECILDAMWDVAKIQEYESINDIKNLLCKIVYNKCCDKLRHTTAKKHGGEVQTYSLEQQFNEETELDTNILDTEEKIYVEQLKPHLTNIEYKLVKLILEEPHILSNYEYARLLNVSETAIRKAKTSLQSKLQG